MEKGVWQCLCYLGVLNVIEMDSSSQTLLAVAFRRMLYMYYSSVSTVSTVPYMSSLISNHVMSSFALGPTGHPERLGLSFHIISRRPASIRGIDF
jgi:hypothetical protein